MIAEQVGVGEVRETVGGLVTDRLTGHQHVESPTVLIVGRDRRFRSVAAALLTPRL